MRSERARDPDPAGEPHEAPRPARSLWPVGIIAALVFVAGVQTAFVLIARDNAPVLESETAYADALEYDQVIAARRAAAALGYTARVEVSADAVTYHLTDPAGAPVTGLTGALVYRRADTRAADASHPLTEAHPGVYRAARPAHGGLYRADARLTPEAPDAPPWLDRRDLVLP